MTTNPNTLSNSRGVRVYAKAERLMSHLDDLSTRFEQSDGSEHDKLLPTDQVALHDHVFESTPNHYDYAKGDIKVKAGILKEGNLEARVAYRSSSSSGAGGYTVTSYHWDGARVSRLDAADSTTYQRTNFGVTETAVLDKSSGDVDYSRHLWGAIPLPVF